MVIPSDFIAPVANHLWQSTVLAVVAALLSLLLRSNRAQVRYWLWLASSVKFLIPFSLLMSLGRLLDWRTAPAVVPVVSSAVEQISQPFALPAAHTMAEAASAAVFPVVPVLLFASWFIGFTAVVSVWWIRWHRLRRVVRRATSLPLEAPIAVRSSPTLLEPGVVGVFRPVLVLPQGIENRLTPEQLAAILAHELCHVRRRDNLAAAVHMLVEAVFWFHPLVWWIGARLVVERERACDEEVVRTGNGRQAYAEGILNVCKLYLESPLACASGVTGADLKERIEAIMTARISNRLTFARKLLLAAAGAMAVAGPILVGILNAAQSKPEALIFEVASIRPADPDARQVSFQLTPTGGVNAVNMGLKDLIRFAYNIPCGKNCDNFISGGPAWIGSQRFDILAKAPQGAEAGGALTSAQRDRVRQRLQALLAERFQLVIRRETKEMPAYALVVARNGHKLKERTDSGERGGLRGERGQMIAENVPIEHLVVNLAGMSGRPVVDRTGLRGRYDFTLEFAPETRVALKGPGGAVEPAGAADPPGPSIFTALQEQLGLKLEATKAPVETIVIERVEKPTAN